MLSISLHLDLHYLPTTELFEDEIFHTNITEDVRTSLRRKWPVHRVLPAYTMLERQGSRRRMTDYLLPASGGLSWTSRESEAEKVTPRRGRETAAAEMGWPLRAAWGGNTRTDKSDQPPNEVYPPPFGENSFLERRWEYLKSVSFPLEEYLQII